MQKTTVYLPEDVKRALGRLASARQQSEASLIREAVASLAAQAPAPRPRGGLWTSGERSLSEQVADALLGFGER